MQYGVCFTKGIYVLGKVGTRGKWRQGRNSRGNSESSGATPILLVTENENFEASKMVFEKPSKQMTQHLKPLC